jgi:hypothetical protein
MMLSATHNSQFTQSLLLFVCFRFILNFCNPLSPLIPLQQSQTQSGNRYTPHLTRFYASLGPSLLMIMIQESLESLNVKCKNAPREDELEGPIRLRVGGYDRRKVMFKGWVDVEKFSYRGTEGSFCVMQRDIVRHRIYPTEIFPDHHNIYPCREAPFHGGNCGRLSLCHRRLNLMFCANETLWFPNIPAVRGTKFVA